MCCWARGTGGVDSATVGSASCRGGGGSGASGNCGAGQRHTDGPGGVDSATVGSVSRPGGGGSGVSGRWQDDGDRGWRFDGGAIAGVDVDA